MQNEREIKKSEAGMEETLENLYKQHNNFAKYYAYRFFAKDEEKRAELVQSTWTRVCEKFGQYKIGTNFRGWLARIMCNLYLNECKNIANKVFKNSEELDTVDEKFASENSVGSYDWRSDVDDRLAKAMESLPEMWRNFVVCKYVMELKQQEIADIYQIKTGTVQSRISRACDRMRQQLRVA